MFGRRTVVPWLTEKADSRPQESGQRCHLCGSSSPAVRCERCSNLIFCSSCDDMYHRHPKRRDHMRKVVSIAPPPPPPRPPPKITDPNKIPVPPPRRRKSQRSSTNSPILGRKQMEQKPELPKKQFPLKFGSLKRFIPGNSNSKPPAAAASPGKEFLQQSQPPVVRWPSEPGAISPACSSGPFGYPSLSQGSLINETGSRMDSRLIEGRYGCNVGQNTNQPGISRRLTPGYLDHGGYYDGESNAAEPSSSDAEEDRGSGACSIGHGSGSCGGSDEWPRTMGSLPPPYGGMTSRSIASLEQIQAYPPQPYQSYSTLSRRNTMMSGTLGSRSYPYGYHQRPPGAMLHSASVCDLSNPMLQPSVVGYSLPQVQSMASLPLGEMEAGVPFTASCGCRPTWVGPDAFGQWHPPARCMIHSSTSNMYSGGTLLKQQHPLPFSPGYSPEGVFHPNVHPGMYPAGMPPSYAYPRPLQTPPPPPRPSAQVTGSTVHDVRATSVERPQSPAASARSSVSRRKAKASSGSNRSRELRSHRRRNRPEVGSTSEEDYFSAGESDEEPEEEEGDRSNLSAGRSRASRNTNGSWECEHCTFINSPGTHICAVCCKTTGKANVTAISEKRVNGRLDSSVQVNASSDASFRTSPGPARYSRTNGGTKSSRNQPKDDGVYEDLEGSQVNHKSAANEKLSRQLKTSLQLNPTKEEVAAEDVGVFDNGKRAELGAPSNSGKAVPVQESRRLHLVDAALDPMESSVVGSSSQVDTQTYATVFKEKVLHAATETPSATKSVTSTGTSPPPQSIATQTPIQEAWMPHDPQLPNASICRSSSRSSLAGDSADLGGIFRSQPSALKRASSLHFSGPGTSDNPWANHFMLRSGSRASLASDHPLGYPSGPPSRDVSPPRNFTPRRDSNLERGYSTLAAFMNHQEERGYGPRGASRKDYYLNLEELVEKRRQETLRTQGLELVRLLREAEQQNFTADDLQVALNHCGSQNPVQWLQDNWKNMIDTVVTLATNYGHDKKENDIGIVSSNEAKDCLRLHKGNIWAAVTECVEQRQKKFTELQHRGHFLREEVVAALTSNQGSVEAAFTDLNKSSLKPFLMRIWGPPAGADNEAGVVWPRQHQSSPPSQESSPVWSVKKEQSSLPASTLDKDFWSTQSNGQHIMQRDFYMNGSANRNQKVASNDDESDLEDYLGLEDVEGLEGSFEEPEEICNNFQAERPEVMDSKDDVFYDAVPGSPSDVLDELKDAIDSPSQHIQEPPLSYLPLHLVPELPTPISSKATFEQLNATLLIATEQPDCATENFPIMQQQDTCTASCGQAPLQPSLVLQEISPSSGAPVQIEQCIDQAFSGNESLSHSNGSETEIIVLPSEEASELPITLKQSFIMEISPPKLGETESPKAAVDACQSEKEKDHTRGTVKTTSNVDFPSEPWPVKDSTAPMLQHPQENPSLPLGLPSLTAECKTGLTKNSTNNPTPKTNSNNLDFSRRVRRLLAEGTLPSYERAEVAAQLMDLKFDESEAMHAALECSDIYMAISYLQQECELCAAKFSMGKMISMLNCIHRCCRNCAKDYFTIKIKERNIMEAVCPFCTEPNLSDDDVAVDYFNNLDILLKNLVDGDIHELFQRKLRDRALMNDPNFHWCYKCSSGFIAEQNRRRLVCPDCKVVTCAQCKKPWEKQHDGISCEKFAEWKQANDPEFQLAGLEKYLVENGIDCPKCKFKYALAKGGCMHFICSQCKFEFCSGCGRPFRMSKKCGMSERCEKLGLHAHHPRNCLFYLRDKEPKDLQKLLDDNHVQYDMEVSCEEDQIASRRCPVVEQKELPDGNEDAMCGREVEETHSGLCRLHYVEYLVSLVNKNALDPVTITDTGGLQQQLKRKEKPVPEQKDGETDEAYRNRLIQMILREIPLEDE